MNQNDKDTDSDQEKANLPVLYEPSIRERVENGEVVIIPDETEFERSLRKIIVEKLIRFSRMQTGGAYLDPEGGDADQFLAHAPDTEDVILTDEAHHLLSDECDNDDE